MTQPKARHVPVLFQDALDFLCVSPAGIYVDCTLGLGGHAEGILRQLGPEGRLIGFDRDPEALELAKTRLETVRSEMDGRAPQLTLIGDAFSRIREHVRPASVEGILADFGVSSLHFDKARRGFSFQADGPLDMRMDTRSGPTARTISVFLIFFIVTGGIIDAEHTRAFAWRGTNAAGEFGKIICLVQAVERLRPEAAINQIVPFGNEIMDRAAAGHAADELAGVAERNAAVHAARALLFQVGFGRCEGEIPASRRRVRAASGPAAVRVGI